MKNICFITALLIAANCFSQTDKKLSAFLSFQVNKTLFDRTITNNSGGMGFGFQSTLDTKTLIKPILEINADLFTGTKVLYITADRRPIYSKDKDLSIYIGLYIQPSERLFITTTLGTSLYNSTAHFGVRPSFGFYTSKSKRWAAKVSFTNVFQKDDISNESFGYVSFALALRLF